jgi:hypothetical protein
MSYRLDAFLHEGLEPFDQAVTETPGFGRLLLELVKSP